MVVAEVLHLDQLAIAAERPEVRDICLDIGTARPPLRAEADECENLISCFDQLLRFREKALSGSGPRSFRDRKSEAFRRQGSESQRIDPPPARAG